VGEIFSLKLKTQSDREPDISLDELGLTSQQMFGFEIIFDGIYRKGKTWKR
jgi:hypothetical protein